MAWFAEAFPRCVIFDHQFILVLLSPGERVVAFSRFSKVKDSCRTSAGLWFPKASLAIIWLQEKIGFAFKREFTHQEAQVPGLTDNFI